MISRCVSLVVHVRLASVLLVLGALSACVGAPREPLDSLSELSSGETIVVGRIELVPPLLKDEQSIKGLGTSGYENKIFLITDDNYRVLKEEPGVADLKGRIEVIIGKNFFVRSDNKPFFILAGMFFISVGNSEMDRAYFPGGYKVSIKQGDRAVYIGTIQYHRNEFFDISKVEIIDDFERANTEYIKKFGKKHPLRKALLTPAK